MIRALIWKEWREYRWKMLILGIILPMAVICIKVAVGTEPAIYSESDFRLIVQWVLNFAAIALSIFIAIETVVGERVTGERQTWGMLIALPVHPWIICAVKLFLGLLTLQVPLFIAALIAQSLFIQHSGVIPTLGINWVPIGGLAASYYLWTVALGMRRATELGVILSGFFFLVVNIVAFGMTMFFEAHSQWLLVNPIYFCDLTEVSNTCNTTTFSVIQLIVLGIPTGLTFWQFNRLTQNVSRKMKLADMKKLGRIADQRLARLWSPRHAMLWKISHETRIMPLMMLGIAIMLGLIATGYNNEIFLRPGVSRPGLEEVGLYAMESTAGFMIALSFLLAVAIGAMVTCADLQPKVDGFWRSRPIDPCDYFWSKYVAGSLMLLLPSMLSWITIFLIEYRIARIGNDFFYIIAAQSGMLMLVYTLTVLLGSVLRRLVIISLIGVALALGIVMPCFIFLDHYNGIDWTLKTVGFAVVTLVIVVVLAKFSERVWVRNWKLETTGS